MAYLREQVANLVVVDADHAAAELGSAKCLNVVLLGAASRAGELGLTEEDLLAAIHTLLPNKLWELNEQALKYTASLS
jgi:indolepyruvate ferredoxin oxidoreductase beta subunit